VTAANVVLPVSGGDESDEEVMETAAGTTADFVAITVADTGSGMSPEVRRAAFDPFFTTKPVGQGSGLGLSQVYGFIKQSRGHVTLDSEPNRGTTVTLFLRRAAPRPPTPGDGEAADSEGSSAITLG